MTMPVVKFAVIMFLLLFYGASAMLYNESEANKQKHAMAVTISWFAIALLAVLWEV